MVRVVGTDPGTSSLDLLLLDDGVVVDQARLAARAAPRRSRVARRDLWTAGRRSTWSPGPRATGCRWSAARRSPSDHLEQMSLVRPDERGRDVGVIGFRAWVRAFVRSGLPLVFLPGGFHLPTIPAHRKVNAIDMGTRRQGRRRGAGALVRRGARRAASIGSTFAVVELGSAFSAILVVERRTAGRCRRRARAGRSACDPEAPGTARSPTGAARSRRTTCSAAAWPTWAPTGPTRFASR